MAFVTKEKFFTKQWFLAYSLIVIGAFILASGFVFFITPYKIIPGGVYGISIVVHYLSEGLFDFLPNGIPIGLFALSMDIPLTILGIKILGPRFGVKTVIGFVLTAVFVDLLTAYVGTNDPLGLADDVLLSSIFGGVVIGFGLGLIFKSRATSGGTDIVAMIIAKYTKISLGRLMIYVDSVIVLIGLAVFQDWKIPLYSWLVIFITGKVIDIVLEGTSAERALFIISDHYELIKNKILKDIERGGTFIPAKGMFSNKDKQIIFTVVNRRELEILKSYISNIDPFAFIAVVEAGEILGEGFKKLREQEI